MPEPTAPTYPDGTPLIEAWSDPAITVALFQSVIDSALPDIPRLEHGFLFAHAVYGRTMATKVDVIAARSVRPHVDLEFPAWSALVTLFHGEGHALCAADHAPRDGGDLGRVPRTKPIASVPLAPGLITLFNGHRLHWLPKGTDRTRFLCASFSFDARPTRAAVRERILADLTGFRLADAA